MIRVHKTGHSIADTVADAVMAGLPDVDIDLDIVYGILRHSVFDTSKCWVHIDKGFYDAGHFEGKYRVSLMGTQQIGFWPEPIPHTMPLQPWRGFDPSKPVLVCPPTDAVAQFFGLAGTVWPYPPNSVLRHKGDPSKINFQDYNYVLTFNSSVGWQGIAAGIPCVSDPRFSMVGSYFKNIPLAELAEKQHIDRERMFGCMSACQLTLDEMRQGKLWPLIEKLLFMSVLMAAKPLPAMSANTPSSAEPSQKLTSNT